MIVSCWRCGTLTTVVDGRCEKCNLDLSEEKADDMTDELRAFRIAPIYEPATDSLMLYLVDVPSYADEVTGEVTVFRSASDGSPIGFEINGIRRLFETAIDTPVD